jgi:hypothetical protein
MAKLVGLENDGIKTKMIYNDDEGNWISKDLPIGVTRLSELDLEIVSK